MKTARIRELFTSNSVAGKGILPPAEKFPVEIILLPLFSTLLVIDVTLVTYATPFWVQ